MTAFDMSWTPELKNKLSTQIDGQLPDFIAEDHPKFSQFLKSYYQFLEAGELRLTVNIDNILLEVSTATNLLNEDDSLIVTESGSGSTGKFIEGEIITGGTSYATATVLVEDLGHTTPRMFISSQQLFETGETVTGATSGASGVVTRYRANPVQNIQQLLAYADIDNTIYDFIEEFRKSFMEGIPNNLATGINKRNLEKHIRELYRRKGTKEAAKLFMRILLDETAEVFYPNQYMMRASDADWDKPTIIRCSSVGSAIGDELVGQSITGQNSSATALVENSTTLIAAAGVSYVEFELSNITGTFEAGETLYGVSSVEDVQYDFVIKEINSSLTISNDGTLYSAADTIDVDSSVLIGSGDVSAKVGEVQKGSVSGVVVDDAGTNYELGDLVVFIDNSSEAGLVQQAQAEVTVIHGNLIDETDSDIILQESGTSTSVELFNVTLEEGTVKAEDPYTVYGTNRTYSNAIGYYYPIYLTNYAAEDSTIVKVSASVNGATAASTTVTLDGNNGTIAVGMRVRGNSISADDTVTVTAVASQTSITISSAQTLLDNELLVLASSPTEIREYTFLEYPGITFYSPLATTAVAQATYVAATYTLYGGNFNHRSDQLYGESGNAASYTGTINTEAVLGDRMEMEWALTTNSLDIISYANEGFILESGDGDITKVTVTDVGEGYSLLPTLTVRSQYGSSTKVLATTTDIGRVESINVTNQGFNYTEAPNLELRSNFVIKDITGTFAVGDTLTSHTGTVRGYDSTTQVIEVSLEDIIASQSESFGTTSNEGMLLEDSLTTNAYVDDNLIMNANLVYGENLVDENGDRLLLNAVSATTDFILLEDDEGELIMEHPNSRLPSDAGHRQVKFVLESLPAAALRLTAEAGNFILLNADLEYEDDVVLNGTDSASVNAGEKLVFNATDASGTNDPSNLIVLEAGLTDDVNEKLLYETDDPFTNLVLDGVDSSSLHEEQKILFEDAGIDFSAGTTSLTTAVASGIIVHADVAKASFTLGTTAVELGAYSGIESLISEELVRIQDSYYYQQFSYEIRSNSSGSAYINELKKAIHPAGFNVFSKVVQTSFVSVAVGTTGASLGSGYGYDLQTYSAILASTFTTLFSETMQRRLGVMDEEDYEILLETSETSILGDLIVLNGTDGRAGFSGTSTTFDITTSSWDASKASDIGDNIEFETPQFIFTDFDAFQIQHGTGQGEFGSLVLNSTDGSSDDGDKIIPESAEAVSNNLILDSEDDNDSNHLLRIGGDLLLESETGGTSFELESSICDGNLVLANERPNIVDNLLDEDSTSKFVGSTTVATPSEVFLRSSITTHLNATINKKHNTSNGLIFLATTDIKSITGDSFQLEDKTTSGWGSRLLITGTEDLSPESSTNADDGDNFLQESGTDVNSGQSITIGNGVTTNTLTGTDNFDIRQEDATLALDTFGDNILLEDDTKLSLERTLVDFVRQSLVNISDDKSLDTIILEEQELGSFKQEDETTVAGTFGDDILLEDATGFGVGDKLILEREFIALEDSLNTGETPFGATGKTTLEPFARPSDIFVRTIGKISLEDYDAGYNMVFNTAVDAGDDILLEDATELDLYEMGDVEFGFSGILATFDNIGSDWSVLRL